MTTNDSKRGWVLAARVLMAVIFLVAGVRKLMTYGATLGYFAKLGIPMADVVLPLTIGVIGQPALPLALMLAVVTVSGFCVVGAQPALIALASSVYPTTVRATGMGWSLGIGRAGSIVGPVLAGWLIGLHWTNSALFIAAAVPALLSCVMVLCMGRLKFTGATARPGETT